MNADRLPAVPLSGLEGGASSVVLCPTARLADDVRRQHGEAKAGQGCATWPALEASTLTQWLGRLCAAALLRGEIPIAAAPRMVLSPAQERRLWERAIAADVRESAPLFDLGGMAATAIEADTVQREWGLRIDDDMRTPETDAFVRWRGDITAVCRGQRWLTPSQAEAWWLECLERGVSGLPPLIGLAGFIGPDPRRDRLLKALRVRGVRVVEVDFLRTAPAVPRIAALADEEAECIAAAEWAAGVLQRSPEARVRIAAADFARLKPRLAEHVDRALHGERVGAAWVGCERAWAVAGGEPLDRSWVASAALTVLDLAAGNGPMSQSRLGEFLRGPGWGSDLGEADARARVEAELRERLPP